MAHVLASVLRSDPPSSLESTAGHVSSATLTRNARASDQVDDRLGEAQRIDRVRQRGLGP
jgi:hypothetical protein